VRRADNGTFSKYQISKGKHGEGQQDPSANRDQEPLPKTWPRSRQTRHVRGEVRLRERMRCKRVIGRTRHEENINIYHLDDER
jgi:hypothetical protein